MTSRTLDGVLPELVAVFGFLDILSRMQTDLVGEAIGAGMSWRALSEHLNAAGIECTPSGLHSRFAKRITG